MATIHSMTGFGQGSAAANGVAVRVEVAAVNRKQADVRLCLPRDLAGLEARLRAQAQARVSRGALTVSVALELAPERRLAQLRPDHAFAKALVASLRESARELGLADDLRLSDVLSLPGVLAEAPMLAAGDECAELAGRALADALDALRAMQAREGAALCADLRGRLARLAALLGAIRAGMDGAVVELRDRLRERLRVLGQECPDDDERLLKEVCFCAERSDIAEEVTRLDSHIAQCQAILAGDGPAGRNLDFLCQEMGREINTLAAKTGATAVVHDALAFRTELERVREQVQNLE